jgi:hypothetical protein
MPQTAQQMSAALRGVSKDMKARASMAGDKGRRATTDVAAMRTAGAGRQYFKDEQSLGNQAKDIDMKASMMDEANPNKAMQNRNTAFAEAVSGTTVKNSAEKMRMFGQTAVPGMPGVRKGGLTDLMMRGKR